MSVDSFLATAENRAALVDVVRKVMARVAPLELEVTGELLVPAIDLLAETGELPFDNSDGAGFFAVRIDLLLPAVIQAALAAMAPETRIGAAEVIRRSRRGRELAEEIHLAVKAAVGEARDGDGAAGR